MPGASMIVASYNVLADAYLRPEWFAAVDPAHLDPAWRRGAILQRIVGLAADVIGLQEVEPLVFDLLRVELAAHGYVGHFARKRGERPDGAAFFVHPPVEVRSVSPLYFQDGVDGQAPSGHCALLLDATWQGKDLQIATTHLRYGPPHHHGTTHIGSRQMQELLAATAGSGAPRIFCGDFNVTAKHDLIQELTRLGFLDAYRDLPHAATCNAKQRAERIDFLMHESALSAVPVPAPAIDDSTVLPNSLEPSDHLPIAARFHWTDPPPAPSVTTRNRR